MAGSGSAREKTGASPAALLVRDFVNTVEWQEDVDGWSTPDSLGGWFAERVGIEVHGLTEDDLLLARRIREGIRSVLLQHAGHDPLPAASLDLDDALARVPLRLRVDDDGELRLTGGPGIAAPIAAVLGAVDTARVEGSWDRLKACARESCRWAYFDASRNRAGRWCSMSWCGNAVKMRARNGNPLRPEELLPPRGTPRPATLVDVAALAGVSIKTVSNVLSGAVPVTPKTRARVEAAVSALDYRPNLAARALAASRGRRAT